MLRTYICDRCPRVAVVVDEDDTLLCSFCFLKATVRALKSKTVVEDRRMLRA